MLWLALVALFCVAPAADADGGYLRVGFSMDVVFNDSITQ